MPLSVFPIPASAPPPPRAAGGATPVPLVGRLGAALARRGVSYCQWKGHGKRERWERGRGDIDLLVEPESWPAFSEVVQELGFKLALPPAGREAAGIVHYFGLDARTGQLVHLHVYQRLVIGAPWRTHYRLPLERALLDSAEGREGGSSVFKTAAPELELVVAILRLTLRHEPRDVLRRSSPRWIDGAVSEVDRLEDHARPEAAFAALRQYLPDVDIALFTRCRASLQPGCPPWRRVSARLALARALAAHRARLSPLAAIERLWHRVRPSGQRLVGGGSVVALLGGDGSGKSTCADALEQWLSGSIATLHVHLGRPVRSLATLVVGGLRKIGRRLAPAASATAHLELLRCVATARDRYALYARARRFAGGGGVAICERYPTPEGWALAGPSEVQGLAAAARSRWADRLRRVERRYYERMAAPDIVFLLRVDPEIAVQRKRDEPAEYVRERARRTVETDWSASGARIVDAGQPLPQVIAALKTDLWHAL